MQCHYTSGVSLQPAPEGSRTLPRDQVEDRRVALEVRRGLSAARQLRDALLSLAVHLAESPTTLGYLILLDLRVTPALLRRELERVQATMRPEIAHRIHVVEVPSAGLPERPSEIPNAHWERVKQRIDAEEATPGSNLPRPDMQFEVFKVLLYQWTRSRGPMTSSWLADTVGCNYRTVAALIKRLGPAIDRLSDRRVQLGYFPREALGRFLTVAEDTRATIRYRDRSAQPRSPESMVGRLTRLGLQHVAIGGVMGARRYLPSLDLVGTPRLDLCCHAPGKHADLAFIRQLDPALERTRDPNEPTRLALHFLRRRSPLFEQDPDGGVWADPVECLFDLYDARLAGPAADLEREMTNRGMK